MRFTGSRWQAKVLLALVILSALSTGCSGAAGRLVIGGVPATTPPGPSPAPGRLTAQSPTPKIRPTITAVTPRIWISPDLPKAFRDQFKLPAGVAVAEQKEAANLLLQTGQVPLSVGPAGEWVYALVTPFPTPPDGFTFSELKAAWDDKASGYFAEKPLLMTQDTRSALDSWWGPSKSTSVKVVDESALLDTAWKAQPSWAIIPFEDISPRWKVLRLDGQSPLDKEFDIGRYPLAMPVRLSGTAEALSHLPPVDLPTNRDPKKLTVLVMTGVTALSRHIGERMEAYGMAYPAKDIGGWLREADLTHISNEVSFYSDCPKPGPDRADMRFCSNPKYIQLLENVGTDIVELTGNHNLDWGPQPFLDTLKMYQGLGWKTFGGGVDLAEAKKPLLIEQNGNKLAFVGCSPAGPAQVWATENTPGSAPCDYEKMEAQVRDLRAGGYLPIVTFQAVETDTYVPPPAQAVPEFRRMAQAGAVVVSGSQSHVPQTMTFVGDNFVHYGLGNLFFDQMSPPETRQEFIDRHIFYDGKYLGVELLTALLEDYSRPRPMKPAEREEFLDKLFSLSIWNGTYP